MHHLSVKEQLPKSSKDVGNDVDAPLCPKPRRLGSPLPAQFLNYLCINHQELISDGRSGILNIIGEKRMDEGKELYGSSRCSLCESPPRPTHNPLIHDVHFLEIHGHDVQIWPQFTPTNT